MQQRPERDVVFVPGLRMPGRSRADVHVFRLLARQLSLGRDASVTPESLFLYAPRDGRAGPRCTPYAAARRNPPAYAVRHTLGRLSRRSAALADALTAHAAACPDRELVVIAYSVGGSLALLALDRLPPAVRDRVGAVVTLACPFAGLDTPRLQAVFGPPMLDHGIPWLEALQRRLLPDLDSAARAQVVAARCGVPVLNVAVEDDVVAPPATALLGWPDAPPQHVEWLRVPTPHAGLRRWGTVLELPEAITALATVHGAVILRRDILRAIGKFVAAGAA